MFSYLVKYEEERRIKDVDVSFWTHQKKRPISGPKSKLPSKTTWEFHPPIRFTHCAHFFLL